MHSERMVVLVVDDEPFIRTIMTDHLSEAGFDVMEAISGRGAVEMLEEDDSIDVVVTDVRMPGGLDGADLARYMAAHHREKKVILASGSFEDMQALIPEGVRRLTKPFEGHQLVAAIKEPMQQF